MLVNELLTKAYDLDDMAETARIHEQSEIAVEQANALFTGAEEELLVSRRFKGLGSVLRFGGITGFSLSDGIKMRETAQVAPAYQTIEHKGVQLDSRLAKLEFMSFDGIDGDTPVPVVGVMLLLGLAHERQKTVSAALYRWGVLHAPATDSHFFNVTPATPHVDVKLRACDADEKQAIVEELNRAVQKLS